jgi:hypothetical protein
MFALGLVIDTIHGWYQYRRPILNSKRYLLFIDMKVLNILCQNSYPVTRIPDPWRFVMDPDSQIHTSGLRILILIFSSVSFKQKSFFCSKFFCLVLTVGTFTSVKIISYLEVKTIELWYMFSIYALVDGRIRFREARKLTDPVRNTGHY